MKVLKVFRERITLVVGLLAILGFVSCNTLTGSGDGSQDDSGDENSEAQTNNPFADGEGTEDNPYEIADLEDLKALNELNNVKAHYVLTSDIDASESENWNDGEGFNPIGYDVPGTLKDRLFEGNFDGNGHTISNLAIDFVFDEDEDEFTVGFFGTIGEGTVKNITLEKISVNTSIASGKDPNVIQTGSLAGVVEDGATVKNITVSGNVSTEDSRSIAGGLVSFNAGRILDSSFDGKVSSQGAAGGLVGRNQSEISGSASSAVVSGIESVGGLVGRLDEGKVINSEATGNVEGDKSVGGLVGFNSTADIKDSKAEGDVSGAKLVGGLVGTANSETSITNAGATGNVQGNSKVGGLAGYSRSNEILDTWSEGDVIGEDNNVGGLIGVNEGKILKSSAEGDVTGERAVGGLVGMGYGSVEKSFASGNVEGSNRVGGLLGAKEEGKVVDSYALGNVGGEEIVGGLIGITYGEITNVFSTGMVSGNTSTGGLIGAVQNEATLEQSYWGIDSSGQTEAFGYGSSSGVTGLTTSEMTGQNAQENMGGLDFENTWTTTDSYPALAWQE